MNTIKNTLIGLYVIGLSVSLPGYADTLSDLRSQCVYCHDVIVSPSGWVLSGTPGGISPRTPAEKTVAGWQTTIASMGDGKCGFINVGPGGTARSVAAQFMYDKQYGTPTATFTATATFTPTATATFTPTPTATTGPTPTATTGPTPTATTATTATTAPTPTATTAPTPTATTMATPTATTAPITHSWYDYDYAGGRCFQKDHNIADRDWCEHHGKKGTGTHPSLTNYDRHAHLDFPGQKP